MGATILHRNDREIRVRKDPAGYISSHFGTPASQGSCWDATRHLVSHFNLKEILSFQLAWVLLYIQQGAASLRAPIGRWAKNTSDFFIWVPWTQVRKQILGSHAATNLCQAPEFWQLRTFCFYRTTPTFPPNRRVFIIPDICISLWRSNLLL